MLDHHKKNYDKEESKSIIKTKPQERKNKYC